MPGMPPLGQALASIRVSFPFFTVKVVCSVGYNFPNIRLLYVQRRQSLLPTLPVQPEMGDDECIQRQWERGDEDVCHWIRLIEIVPHARQSKSAACGGWVAPYAERPL